MSRVLLTGADGTLGRHLRRSLPQHGFTLRSTDLQVTPLSPEEESVRLDLRDGPAVAQAVLGCAAIVHLGGLSTESGLEAAFDVNVRGTFHVLDAASRHGVPKVVLASSHHVVGLYEASKRLDMCSPPQADSVYGITKLCCEQLANLYSFKCGLDVICLRLGSVRTRPSEHRHHASWLSFADFTRLVIASLTCRRSGCTVVYGVSANSGAWWPRDNPIGFRAQDSADSYRDLLERTTPSPEDAYQGGAFVAEPISS